MKSSMFECRSASFFAASTSIARGLRQIVEETFTRLSKKMSLKRKTDAPDVEEMARNMSGLTSLRRNVR